MFAPARVAATDPPPRAVASSGQGHALLAYRLQSPVLPFRAEFARLHEAESSGARLCRARPTIVPAKPLSRARGEKGVTLVTSTLR